jgi:hypothetical protein
MRNVRLIQIRSKGGMRATDASDGRGLGACEWSRLRRSAEACLEKIGSKCNHKVLFYHFYDFLYC